MGSRPMRILLKPYKMKDRMDGKTYWRAMTDFPCGRKHTSMYGKGIDKMTALTALKMFLPREIREAIAGFGEEHMFPMPDQLNFEYWQLNLDGSKPTREEWLYQRQYYNTFGHLPND